MKSSIRSRSLKLLSLAAKVGRQEIAQTVKEQFAKGVDEIASGRMKARIDQAKVIAENLSQLKGAAMKAGQLLSLDAADYFPPEAIEALSKLQGKAEPVEWSIIKSVLDRELGEKAVGELTELNPEPVASASIGQVHRAKLHGREVAIKVQYPGVADAIDSDLKILKTFIQGFLTLSGRRMDLAEAFAELSSVLHQEADYHAERDFMREYGKHLAGHSDFSVPEPIDSHSSERVLTMTWQNGVSLGDWLKTNPSHEERARIGRLLLDLYCKEFYEWGLVQTDPNYANFLIQSSPAKLAVLDFGATLRYTEDFRKHYVSLLNVMETLDRSRILRTFTEAGLIDERESHESRELLLEMLFTGLEPFRADRQPFRFNDDDFARRTREVTQKFSLSLKYSPPPRELIFLHRKLAGVFAYLKRLDVQIDVRPYWERMRQSATLMK